MQMLSSVFVIPGIEVMIYMQGAFSITISIIQPHYQNKSYSSSNLHFKYYLKYFLNQQLTDEAEIGILSVERVFDHDISLWRFSFIYVLVVQILENF